MSQVKFSQHVFSKNQFSNPSFIARMPLLVAFLRALPSSPSSSPCNRDSLYLASATGLAWPIAAPGQLLSLNPFLSCRPQGIYA